MRAVGERAAAQLRHEGKNSVYWSVYYPPNFGDWVGPYLFLRLTGREPYFRLPDGLSRSTVYFTAGSILGLVESNCIVWGSGIIAHGQRFPRPWRTHAVRGPYTRRAFLDQGYECPEVYGDPAILLPRVYDGSRQKTHELGVIPHFRDYPEVAAWYRDDPAIKIIDVRHALEKVVDDITACRATVSSSLHGVIVSHAYGIPSAWVRFSDRLGGDGVKFLDYFASAGVADAAAVDVRQRIDGTRLREMALAAVQPRLEPLMDPLLRACPFVESGPR
jgi:hypothetical protein